jgi:hypothetical protein
MSICAGDGPFPGAEGNQKRLNAESAVPPNTNRQEEKQRQQKCHNMKTTAKYHLQLCATFAVALLPFLSAPDAARAGNQVPYRATWDTDISITPLDAPLVAVSGLGKGLATHLGAMTAQSIHEVVNLATGEGSAQYRFIAANGDEIFVSFALLAVPISPIAFHIQGTWEITGGTGRFVGASGSGTYTGQVEFTGPATAVGHFVANGSISSPGSLK